MPSAGELPPAVERGRPSRQGFSAAGAGVRRGAAVAAAGAAVAGDAPPPVLPGVPPYEAGLERRAPERARKCCTEGGDTATNPAGVERLAAPSVAPSGRRPGTLLVSLPPSPHPPPSAPPPLPSAPLADRTDVRDRERSLACAPALRRMLDAAPARPREAPPPPPAPRTNVPTESSRTGAGDAVRDDTPLLPPPLLPVAVGGYGSAGGTGDGAGDGAGDAAGEGAATGAVAPYSSAAGEAGAAAAGMETGMATTGMGKCMMGSMAEGKEAAAAAAGSDAATRASPALSVLIDADSMGAPGGISGGTVARADEVDGGAGYAMAANVSGGRGAGSAVAAATAAAAGDGPMPRPRRRRGEGRSPAAALPPRGLPSSSSTAVASAAGMGVRGEGLRRGEGERERESESERYNRRQQVGDKRGRVSRRQERPGPSRRQESNA